LKQTDPSKEAVHLNRSEECGSDQISYIYTSSPLGSLLILSRNNAITDLYPESHKNKKLILDKLYLQNISSKKTPLLQEADKQLRAYFKKELQYFDLPLLYEGTEFQKKVWQALRTIPYGKTWSYKELSLSIGHLQASRAVGSANGHNPISIIIPCHRVIATNGNVAGYAGGVKMKEYLIELER
jgi:methylated-DNA-[protein]-cysteine S-methyltransferase